MCVGNWLKQILQYKGSSFPADRSKAVPLLQFFFVRLWFNVFLLSLFVFHFSFFLYLERVVLYDCAFPGYLQLYFRAWKKCSRESALHPRIGLVSLNARTTDNL